MSDRHQFSSSGAAVKVLDAMGFRLDHGTTGYVMPKCRDSYLTIGYVDHNGELVMLESTDIKFPYQDLIRKVLCMPPYDSSSPRM